MIFVCACQFLRHRKKEEKRDVSASNILSVFLTLCLKLCRRRAIEHCPEVNHSRLLCTVETVAVGLVLHC